MGASMAVVDFVHLGASLSIRSACRIGSNMDIRVKPRLSIADVQTYIKYDSKYYTSTETWGSYQHTALLWYTQGTASLRTTSNGGSLHGLWYLDADGANMEASASDRRLKKNIRPLFETLRDASSTADEPVDADWKLDSVMQQLRPKAYKLKGDRDNIRFGFIADEMDRVLPQITRTSAGPDGRMGIMYQDLIAFLTNMMQDLFTDLSDANSRLQSVEGRIQQRKEWRRGGSSIFRH